MDDYGARSKDSAILKQKLSPASLSYCIKQQNLHKLMPMKIHVMAAVTAVLLLISSIPVVMADDKKEVKDPLTEKYAIKEKEIGAALKSGLISKELAEKILNEYERQLKADQRRGQFRNRQAGRAFGEARDRADKAREDAKARMEERLKNRGQAEQRKEQFRNGSVDQIDKDGRYLLKIKDGAKHFKVEADGAVIFDGPVDTADQRKKVKNADLLNKLKQLEAQLVNRAAAFRARQRPGGFNGDNPFKELNLTEEQQKKIAAIRLKQSEEHLEYSEMMKELDETYQKRMEGLLTDEQMGKYKEVQSQQGRRPPRGR